MVESGQVEGYHVAVIKKGSGPDTKLMGNPPAVDAEPLWLPLASFIYPRLLSCQSYLKVYTLRLMVSIRKRQVRLGLSMCHLSPNSWNRS